ncbi:hypothetical protein BJ085DRAFT_38124 [Dimargaris cristalligena]|uniref:Uncharacterized protein n=1 Tax=Dimargaris cristalligena TaxID=215637 RepID=A0A4Q0A124_9FUNG|nr:hypothetical protein BJ085DRAFT_38124 [Dimargaris cristalligena]|eukprot:RKP38830.1 hypothetical protein BJ085DRAFT_38124 [Dimargaris cristalligena]
MDFNSFRIPETRLLCVRDEVIQVSLRYFNHHSEEYHTIYEKSAELQEQIQLAVLCALRCGFAKGVIRGNGYSLHHARKPWPLSVKYRFYKNQGVLPASSHKYNFYLEFTDEALDA